MSSLDTELLTPERIALFHEFLVFHAACSGQADLLTKLIDKGVSLLIKDYDHRTPLHVAAANDKLTIAKILVKYSANINALDRFGKTPLSDATENRSFRVLHFLRECGGILGNKSDSREALADAAEKEDIDTLKILVQSGIDVNGIDFDGRTVLHRVAAIGRINSVKFLVQNGAKVLVKDRWGLVPLQYAKDNKHAEVVSFLEHSFQVESPLKRSRTLPQLSFTTFLTNTLFSPATPQVKPSQSQIHFTPTLKTAKMRTSINTSTSSIMQEKFSKNIKKSKLIKVSRDEGFGSPNFTEAQAKKLELLTETEAQTRKIFGMSDAKHILQDQDKKLTLFDLFFVVAMKKNSETSVVFRYPKDAMLDVPYLGDFCFPAGMDSASIPQTHYTPPVTRSPTRSSGNFTSNRPKSGTFKTDFITSTQSIPGISNGRKNSLGSGNSIAPNPPQVVHSNNPQNSFVFILTTKFGETLYCTCVVDDVLATIPPFIPRSDIAQTNNLVLCYCIVTRYPLFQPFFKFIYSVLDIVFYDQIMNDQNELDSPMSTKNGSDSSVKQQILDLLERTYKQEIPVPGQLLRLVNTKLAMPHPSDSHQHIAQYCGHVLFQTFSEKKLLWLLSAVLCEKSIVFACSQLRKLSSIVLSFIPLIYPLAYVSTLIPILPNKLHSIVDAPVPFMVGMINFNIVKDEHDLPADVIVVNVDDSDSVNVIPSAPNVSELPNQKKLLETIAYFYDKKNQPPVDEVSPIFGHVNSFILSSLLSLNKFCITDLTKDVTVFWGEEFLAEQPENHLGFYKQFLETQLFRTYMDKKTREYDSQRRNGSRRSTVF